MISVVLGRRGMGKTFYVKSKIMQWDRILIFDTMSEYSNTYFDQVYGQRGFVDYWRRRRGAARFRLIFRDAGQIAPIFDALCQWVYEVGNMAFVVEELSFFAGASFAPEPLATIIRCGRHRNIDLIATAQRAADVPKVLIALANQAVIFNQSEPNSLDYLSKWIPVEMVRALPRLTQGQRLKFDFDRYSGVIENRS